MKLTNLELKNFRGFKDVKIELGTMTAFVGTNSSGKSTVLQAIQKLLDTKEKFEETDFHLLKESRVEIIGHFDLSEEARKSISEQLGVPIKNLHLKKVGMLEEGLKTDYKIGIPDFGNPLLNPSYVSGKTLPEYRKAAEEGNLPNQFLNCNRVGEAKELLKDYLFNTNLKVKGTNWIEAKPTELKEFIPDTLYIPAFENIEKHTAYAKTNFFGMMLRNIFEKLEDNNDYKRFKNQYENLTTRIFSPDANKRVKDITDFENSLTGYIQEILPTRVTLDFSVPEISEFMLKNFSIHLDDGVKTPVTGKGHGAQRAIIWALLRYFLDNVKSSGDKETIFLVEEPELYLHPQAQRVMLKTLKELTERGQVVYSSHSPVFVDLENPESIRVIRKQGTNATIFTLPPVTNNEREQIRYLKWMGDAHNEIFFAKSVILYEGATEKLILTHMNRNPTTELGDVNLEKRLPRVMNLDELGCQLISTGGKFSMPFFTKLLTEARIPFFVIYDYDSSSGGHAEINDHIERNIRRAKEVGLNAGSFVHHPFLEKDWKIPFNEENKADTMYSLLSKDSSDWGPEMKRKYENVRKTIYKFAWSAYLGLPYQK